MQTLYLKIVNPDGTAGRKKVTIVRSWHEGSGRIIYLHQNGVYGYKDGSPVKDLRELDTISDPYSKKLAVFWWNSNGKLLSDEYYRKQGEHLERLAARAAGQAAPGDNSGCDQIYYMRRPVKNRARSAFSDPATWSSFFDRRPDWWGAANVIEIGEWRYERVDPEAIEQVARDEKAGVTEGGEENATAPIALHSSTDEGDEASF
jgi:hypothetical protein